MKDRALALAKRGLVVFPIKPGDKTPICKNGCKDATTNEETITGWWSAVPEANICIATGAKSGVWVLDIDGEEGEASLREIESRMGQLPPTVEAITGGGGRHLFFKLPDFDDAPVIRNSAGQLGTGLDVRCSRRGWLCGRPAKHSPVRAQVCMECG
jgi:hypothetical protein